MGLLGATMFCISKVSFEKFAITFQIAGDGTCVYKGEKIPTSGWRVRESGGGPCSPQTYLLRLWLEWNQIAQYGRVP